jgi:hypothetical protein
MQASALHINGHVVIKGELEGVVEEVKLKGRADNGAGRPCKIVEMWTSKGKHGHDKVHLVAIDVRGFIFYYLNITGLTHLHPDLYGEEVGGCQSVHVRHRCPECAA